jgi:uncharacterized RDD family membrane protein YckC
MALSRLRALLGRGGGAAAPLARKLTLADQTFLPPDLRLPRPGDPLTRIRAGIIDAALAACVGGCVGAAAHLGLGVTLQEAVGYGNGGALLLWVARDTLAPGRNRSPGKAAMGLELATRDGMVAAPGAAALRNAHFLLLLAAPLHPVGAVALEAALFFDAATCVFTPDARKVGDYVAGCRVVEERPGRSERLRDAAEAAEARALEARVRAAAPGLLEAEGLGARHWWEEGGGGGARFLVEPTAGGAGGGGGGGTRAAAGGGAGALRRAEGKVVPPIFEEVHRGTKPAG